MLVIRWSLYIKLSKMVRMWGLPDTLRLRMVPGDLQLKTVKVSIENAYGDRYTVDYPVGEVEGEVTLDMPASDFCDVSDLGNFPLQLIYYHISFESPTVDAPYSLKIPGMELVYANMPQDVVIVCDVNGDYEVNIADVNAIINMILSGITSPTADVNSDGEVNIADVNTVIDLILQ